MTEPPEEVTKPIPLMKLSGGGVVSSIVKSVWIVMVLVWPFLRWIVALDVVFQFVKMLWNWHTPGTYSGWNFLLHFGVLTALTYFVSLYKPKDI